MQRSAAGGGGSLAEEGTWAQADGATGHAGGKGLDLGCGLVAISHLISPAWVLFEVRGAAHEMVLGEGNEVSYTSEPWE